MSDTAYIAEFADNLWNKYMKLKLADELQDDVRFYKAQVVQNPGNGTLVVQKPYEDAVTISCTNDMKTVAVGKMVTVLVFGTGNAANHIAVSAAGMKDLKITGSDAAADYVVESGSGTTGMDSTRLIDSTSYGRWQKWNSGKLEIWGSVQLADVVTTKTPLSSGGYISSVRFPCWGTWPVAFTEPPVVTCKLIANWQEGNGNYIQTIECFAPTAGGTPINRLTQSPYYTVWCEAQDEFIYRDDFPYFSFSAVGMWK